MIEKQSTTKNQESYQEPDEEVAQEEDTDEYLEWYHTHDQAS